jgi:hypothetical protein
VYDAALGLSLLRLLRPHRGDEQRARHLYVRHVQQLAERLGSIYDEWGALRDQEPENQRLANVAAVKRWEVMRLLSEAEQLEAPRALGSVQRDLQNALVGAARACQLLANGYRSHKSEAVCDGQALLVETVQDVGALVDQLQMR